MAPTTKAKTKAKTTKAKQKSQAKKSGKKASKTTTKTKSSTVKKSAKSKTKAKLSEPQERVLVCANEKQCFWTTDGKILKDLTELRDALKSMTVKVFDHHVTKDKNDFADWVEHVLDDSDCATALRKSHKSNTARTVVVRHLKYYSL